MKVSDYIGEAWAAVTSAGVPDNLQELAFQEALAYLRQNSPRTAVPAIQNRDQDEVSDSVELVHDGESVADLNSFLDKLAHESGADREALGHLFDVDDTGIHLRLPARDLGGNKKEKCLRIATLMVPAHIILTGDQRVSADVVRNECKAKSCYDHTNFAKYMRDLRQITYGGTGTKRDFVLGGGWEPLFRDAVHDLTGLGGAPLEAT